MPLEMEPVDEQRLQQAVAELTTRFGNKSISGGAVLGSGFGAVADELTIHDSIAFDEVPVLGTPQVPGHAGRIVLAEVLGNFYLLFCGRRHLYELPGWNAIVFPLFALKQLQAPWVLLTNAAGGLSASLSPGDLLVICDHINLTGMNPFLGSQTSSLWQELFLDQTKIYDAALRSQLHSVAERTGLFLREGTYVQVLGPCYESPAETKMLRSLGADAVGMSTVVEALAARALGLRTVALSCITNLSSGMDDSVLSHKGVIDILSKTTNAIARLLVDFFLKASA